MTERRAAWSALLAALVLAAPARAETLAQAVTAAIAANPTLAAARDRQDALSEVPNQARAAGRLTAEADASGGYDRYDYGRGGVGSLTAQLPIWTGGRVPAAVRATTADVAAGAEGLRDTAQAVLEQVVGAYAGVQFQQQAVAIAQADIELLDNQVAEARARFDLGTGTQTDVARLLAQRDGAAATRASAEAALAGAAASFRALVGHAPGDLAPAPAALAGTPVSRAQARDRALGASPLYLASLAARGAADARIGVARAGGAPYLALGGTYGYGLSGRTDPLAYPRAAAIGVSLRVPVLTGGLVASQVRQARAEARATDHDADAAALEAIRAADTAWANLEGARLRVAANERAVAAADRALAGVKAEYAVGLRTTLDILIADESLRGAQLALAAASADRLIGEAALLRAVGALDGPAFG